MITVSLIFLPCFSFEGYTSLGTHGTNYCILKCLGRVHLCVVSHILHTDLGSFLSSSFKVRACFLKFNFNSDVKCLHGPKEIYKNKYI